MERRERGGRGSRLAKPPDAPTPERVLAGLDTALFRQLVYLPETGSTNDVVRAEARAGAPEGLVVIADRQTAGRGRRGRAWDSPAGLGLWFSVLLRPTFPARQAPLLALMAAAAVRDAVAATAGVPVLVKWPNDVVSQDGRKLSGILVEMEADGDFIRHCVVGIGVNVNQALEDFPPEVRETATSLGLLAGGPVARVPLLQAILAGLEARYRRVLADGFGAVLDEVRRHSATLGRDVQVVETGGQAWDGRAVAILDDGALLVEPAGGGEARRVYAADVSIRETNAPTREANASIRPPGGGRATSR